MKQKRAQRKYNLKAHLVELCSQTLCCAIAGQGSLTEDFGLTSWVRWSCWFLFKPYRVSLSLCRISSQVSRKGNHSGLRIHAEVQIGWTVSKQAVANAIRNLHRKWKEKSEFFPFFSFSNEKKKKQVLSLLFVVLFKQYNIETTMWQTYLTKNPQTKCDRVMTSVINVIHSLSMLL